MNHLRAEVALLLSLAATACGGNHPAPTGHSPSPAAYYGAGSRLKPIVYSIGDGVDVRHWGWMGHWMDVGLDVECDFERLEDGAMHCIPAIGQTARVAYLDAGCSVPVGLGYSDQCGPVQHFADEFLTSSCASGGIREHRIVGNAPRPTALFDHSIDDDSCKPIEIPNVDGFPFFALEALPPTAFVAGTSETQERVPGLAADVWQGDDGSWETVGFVDSARGERCGPLGVDKDPERRCLPDHDDIFSDGSEFADAACQVPAIRSLAECGRTPPHVAVKASSMSKGCETNASYEVYQLNDTGQQTGFWSDGATCSPSPPDKVAWEVQTIGPKVDLASFPVLELHEFSSGRLKAAFLGFGGIPFLPGDVYPQDKSDGFLRGSLFDTVAGEGCRVFPLPDGTFRCVPIGWDIVGPDEVYRTRPDCTGDRVIEHRPSEPSCVAHVEPAGVVFTEGQALCAPKSLEVALVSPFAGTKVYRGAGGTDCTAIASTDLHPLYLVGATHDPAEFFAEIKREQRN